MRTYQMGDPLPTFNDYFDALIIIPTVGKPEVLIPSFDLLLRRLDGLKVQIIISLNPLVEADGEASARECQRLWDAYNMGASQLEILNAGKAVGFGEAINIAVRHQLNKGTSFPGVVIAEGNQIPGFPTLTVIFNDDLRATHGWLKGMLDGLNSKTVCDSSEMPGEDGRRPIRDMGVYMGEYTAGIGIIGPMTNCAAGLQQIGPDDMKDYERLGAERFAALWQERYKGQILTADFLSGYCMAITFACLRDLYVDPDTDPAGVGYLFDPIYKIAGYEDNDLCVRAAKLGFRMVVDAGHFIGHVGHQTFDASFPEMQRGMRNRLAYYDRWASKDLEDPVIVGAYRIRLEVPSDIKYLRMSLVKHGSILDKICILLTANPAIVLQSQEVLENGLEWLQREIGHFDCEMLMRCVSGRPDHIVETFAGWAKHWSWRSQNPPHAQSRNPEIQVSCNVGNPGIVNDWLPLDERAERNRLLSLAEQDADWILSIDHDEVLEPRVNREHLVRLTRHPDPLVESWDVAFVNHWENSRMTRIDYPWGDRGTFTGSMRGYRFFRVNRANPKRIIAGGHNGLHCGNVPSSDWSTKRVAGIRFRHFGYMQHQDRARKEARYNVQDPNPDPALIGNVNYSHITDDAVLTLSPFVMENGIGLHMLVHSGETADDIARILDHVYGLVDKIVFVWTEETSVDYQSEIYRMAAHFGVEWVHHPLRDDIAAARNAGIEALRGTPAMGWSWFMDPDEYLPEQGAIFLRRMAEAPDCWGWLFRFVNRTTDGGGNWSESIRMARLDPGGLMRLSGRVHESFEPAIRKVRESGVSRVVRTVADPMVCVNRGLSKTPQEMQAKLEFYRRLVEQDLKEDPNNAGGWVTLGLYWANQGCDRVAEECFARGVSVEQGQYLPFQELGLLYLRRGRAMMAEAAQRMGSHKMRGPWEKLVDILNTGCPDAPILGAPTLPGYVVPDEAEAMASLPPMG